MTCKTQDIALNFFHWFDSMVSHAGLVRPEGLLLLAANTLAESQIGLGHFHALSPAELTALPCTAEQLSFLLWAAEEARRDVEALSEPRA